ncbi:MAG: APC family permease [Lachnospiraceae bacterium]|nr:APC family permease [Lachnospiraceae bacterium]
MGNNQSDKNQQLTPYFNRMGILAFSIGTSIGWGSFVVTCNTYLFQAGVLGTILGSLLGMVIILIINHNLCYMIERKQDAGGIYAYACTVRGHDLAFVVAWFLLLTYLAIFWGNLTALPLFAGRFLSSIFQVGPSYVLFGYRVYLGEVVLSVLVAIVGGVFCANFKKIPQYLMIIMAVTFMVSLAVITAVAVIKHDSTGFSYNPLYIADKTNWGQIVRIAVVSPWAYIGFENVVLFTEEYSFPVEKIRGVMITAVILTTAVYILLTVLSITAFPPEYSNWFEYICDMSNLSGISSVPAFYAAKYYFGNAGVTLMLLALFSVIVTSLIGNLTAISRLLYAYGRDHSWLGGLSKLNKNNIPKRAIYLTVLISCFVLFLGRNVIGWIVYVTTLGAAIVYGILSYLVYRDARSCDDIIEQNTGMFGMAVMTGIAVLSLFPKIISFETMQPESYLLFAAWSILGLFMFCLTLKNDKENSYHHSAAIGIIFILLTLVSTILWVCTKQ